MNGINKVNLLGNLGADPELKMLPGGNALLKLSLATNESYKDKNGVEHERVEWHRVSVFGKQAEGLARFVRKGWKVFVEGRIEYSTYEKEGQKHYGTDIVALRVHALAPPTHRAAAEAGAGASLPPPLPPRANGGFATPGAVSATEIPF